jgi:hypothetical protein
MGYFSDLVLKNSEDKKIMIPDGEVAVAETPVKKKRGRPAGSKNKTTVDSDGYIIEDEQKNSLTML